MRRSSRFLITVIGIAAIVFAAIALHDAYRMPILMYHSVGFADDHADRRVVSPEAFERQMRYLHDAGYRVITLEEAVGYLARRDPPPRKTIAITFDDGLANNHRYAYPVLKRFGIPATIFVIVGSVGKEPFLTWGEIEEMVRSGIVDIESHTVSHGWLTGLDDDSLRRELTESKRVLEERLGRPVRYLCYPMGGYDERVKAAAKSAGYEAAFATKPLRSTRGDPLYEIKRIRISPTADSIFVFRLKLSGYHAFFRIAQENCKELMNVLWKRKGS